MPHIIRFEIQASEPQVLIDFYTALFGWRFTEMRPMQWWKLDMGPGDQGGIPGGLVRRSVARDGSQSINAFICMIEVESLDAMLTKAVALGAVIALPRLVVPTKCWMAYIKDPDGNLMSLMQVDANAR